MTCVLVWTFCYFRTSIRVSIQLICSLFKALPQKQALHDVLRNEVCGAYTYKVSTLHSLLFAYRPQYTVILAFIEKRIKLLLTQIPAFEFHHIRIVQIRNHKLKSHIANAWDTPTFIWMFVIFTFGARVPDKKVFTFFPSSMLSHFFVVDLVKIAEQ